MTWLKTVNGSQEPIFGRITAMIGSIASAQMSTPATVATWRRKSAPKRDAEGGHESRDHQLARQIDKSDIKHRTRVDTAYLETDNPGQGDKGRARLAIVAAPMSAYTASLTTMTRARRGVTR